MPCNHPKYILRSDRSWYCTSCGEKVPSQTPPANGDMIRLEPGPEVPEKDAYLNAIHRDLREVTEMLYGLCEEVWYLDQEHVVDLPEATKAWYQWHKARKDLTVNRTGLAPRCGFVRASGLLGILRRYQRGHRRALFPGAVEGERAEAGAYRGTGEKDQA